MHFMYLLFQQIRIDLLLMGQELGWTEVQWITKYVTLPVGKLYSMQSSFKRQSTN